MTERPIYRDGYVRVGDSSEYMDVAIDISDAHALRDSVIDTFATPHGIAIDGFKEITDEANETYLQYKAFFRAKNRSISTDDFISEQSVFVGALINQAQDTWRMTIMHNRFGRIDDGTTEQRVNTIYRVVCWGQQVMEAKRTVKLVKSTASLALIGANSRTLPALERRSKRVGFTTALQPEDCLKLANVMDRHSRRVKIERGL